MEGVKEGIKVNIVNGDNCFMEVDEKMNTLSTYFHASNFQKYIFVFKWLEGKRERIDPR